MFAIIKTVILIKKHIIKNTLTLKKVLFIGLLSLIFNSNSYSQTTKLSLDIFDSNFSIKSPVPSFNIQDENNSFNTFSSSEEVDNRNNLENNFDLVSYTFSYGFLGYIEKNNQWQKVLNISTFSTLGISSI